MQTNSFVKHIPLPKQSLQDEIAKQISEKFLKAFDLNPVGEETDFRVKMLFRDIYYQLVHIGAIQNTTLFEDEFINLTDLKFLASKYKRERDELQTKLDICRDSKETFTEKLKNLINREL